MRERGNYEGCMYPAPIQQSWSPLGRHGHSNPFPPFDFVFSLSQNVANFQPCPLRDIILPTLLLLAPSSPSLHWMHAQYCKPTGPYKRTTYDQSIGYIYGQSLPLSTHVFSGDYFLKTELIKTALLCLIYVSCH